MSATPWFSSALTRRASSPASCCTLMAALPPWSRSSPWPSKASSSTDWGIAHTAYQIGKSAYVGGKHLLLLDPGWNFNRCRRFRLSGASRSFPQQRPEINPDLVTNNLYPEFRTAENMHSAHHNRAE